MHVQNVAVYDVEFEPSELRDRVVQGNTRTAEAPRDEKSDPSISVSEAARENLAQFGAVAGICNAATFAAQQAEKPLRDREIIGDATGEFGVGKVILMQKLKTRITRFGHLTLCGVGCAR